MSPSASPPRVRIGCAGWSIPSRHAHLFGDGDSHLARYATRFDVVEINSTFYRPHQARTFERWAASVPAGFRFSVKAPKAITHEARLHGVGDALSAFLDSVAGLGRKLGGVLVQLPPSLAFDARVAERFLAMLRRRTATRVALEPRHASWFTSSADAVLLRHAVARVAVDPSPVPDAARPGGGGRRALAVLALAWRAADLLQPLRGPDVARAGRRAGPPGHGPRAGLVHPRQHCARARDGRCGAVAALRRRRRLTGRSPQPLALPWAASGPVEGAVDLANDRSGDLP